MESIHLDHPVPYVSNHDSHTTLHVGGGIHNHDWDANVSATHTSNGIEIHGGVTVSGTHTHVTNAQGGIDITF